MMYKTIDGCGHVAVQPDKTFGRYLQDRVQHAESTQNMHVPASTSVFTYHKGQSVGRVSHSDFAPMLVLATNFVGNNNIQLPHEIPAIIMNNETRYTRSAIFESNDSGVDIKHFVIENMLVQVLEPTWEDLDGEDVVSTVHILMEGFQCFRVS